MVALLVSLQQSSRKGPQKDTRPLEQTKIEAFKTVFPIFGTQEQYQLKSIGFLVFPAKFRGSLF